MKNSFTYLLIFFLALPCLSQKNLVKVNLSSLAIQNVYASYERTFAKKFSLQIGFSMLPSRGIPFASNFEEINGNESPMRQMKMSGWGVTPEVRLYTSIEKGSPRGFYVAPYLRLNQLEFKLDGYDYRYNDIYHDNRERTSQVDFSGRFSSFGGGIMIGHQWILGRHVAIDFWILGLGINSSSFSLKAQSEDMDPRYFQKGSEFSDDITDYLKVLNQVEVISGKDFVEAKSRRTLPGLRGLGLNIGIAF